MSRKHTKLPIPNLRITEKNTSSKAISLAKWFKLNCDTYLCVSFVNEVNVRLYLIAISGIVVVLVRYLLLFGLIINWQLTMTFWKCGHWKRDGQNKRAISLRTICIVRTIMALSRYMELNVRTKFLLHFLIIHLNTVHIQQVAMPFFPHFLSFGCCCC